MLYHSGYLTNHGGSILLLFINLVLSAFSQHYRFPVTPATVQKHTGFDFYTKNVQRLVACPVCHAVYTALDEVPSHCTFSLFPETEDACGAPLFVKRNRPRKTYAYHSLKTSLEYLFSRPDFEDKINDWHRRNVPTGLAFDVYDGEIWSQIPDPLYPDTPYVDHPRALLLTLNVDWFQPHNGQYSCGAISLTINNLPRTERFRTENVILVGLMPGPREPKTLEINQYLAPLVDELEELYRGVQMKTSKYPTETVTVRAALLNVACDIPAARKVSGFTAMNSKRACFKCDRDFESLASAPNRRDFSGFDTTKWPLMNRKMHLNAVSRWIDANDEKKQQAVEKETGVRWTELCRLEYFDVVRCTVVDPMHNLFLGTPKRIMKYWIDNSIISKQQLKRMQVIADAMLLPPSLDVLQNKIADEFKDMQASDWKSWCLCYSPLLLHDVLPKEQFENWMYFVDACRLLATPSIEKAAISKAHELLMKFCSGCERLYGLPYCHLICICTGILLHAFETSDRTTVFGYSALNVTMACLAISALTESIASKSRS